MDKNTYAHTHSVTKGRTFFPGYRELRYGQSRAKPRASLILLAVGKRPHAHSHTYHVICKWILSLKKKGRASGRDGWKAFFATCADSMHSRPHESPSRKPEVLTSVLTMQTVSSEFFEQADTPLILVNSKFSWASRPFQASREFSRYPMNFLSKTFLETMKNNLF